MAIPICPDPVVVAQPKPHPLQLGLGLRLLQDGVQLGRLHDVSLDLELPGHEQPLCVALAGDKIAKVGVGELESYVGLLAEALGNLALALQVDVPALGLSGGVLEGKGVDTVSLLDGVFLVGFAGIQGLVDGLEGSRGGELLCSSDRLSVKPVILRASSLSVS